MIKNQLGRRNLTPQEASYYRGKLYESRKLGHGGDRTASGKNYHLKTAEQIGKEYGVTERTVRNDAEFSKSVDKVALLDKKVSSCQVARLPVALLSNRL
ncbi:MAG TPA: hypothetical protein PLE90_02890 [Dysgonamonadaceae bacterium]|jgi:hypothetical protein|nr:hypothetical protein [Dysgonamonadaceae bacterium]